MLTEPNEAWGGADQLDATAADLLGVRQPFQETRYLKGGQLQLLCVSGGGEPLP